MPFSQSLKKICFRLARPDILFWTLPFMILVLVVGTIAQKEMGILAAQQTYFSSFYYWLGFLPFPGGMTLVGLMFVNLLAKFLFRSDWAWQKAGTILSHFGVLVLLLGGGVTYFSAHEGYLTVGEGETSQKIEDYHQRMLVIRSGDFVHYQMPFESLLEGQVIELKDSDLKISLDKLCYNCGITRRNEAEQDGWTSPGKFMQLNPKPSDPQDEKNMTGVEFSVSGLAKDAENKYLTFDKFPKPPIIEVQNKTYMVAIERQTRTLPFSITLEKFKQDFHPGTDMASAYQSKVIVKDEGGSWPALIQMNEPLRYRGYTLYQSSFDVSGDKPYTILAVVENKGRIFPYISTVIIALGLILHLVIRLSKRGTK